MSSLDEEPPDHYVNEHTLGALVGYLIRLTVGELPPWVVDGMLPEVAEDLMKSLDVLIRSGLAQAREIEERIAASIGTTPMSASRYS